MFQVISKEMLLGFLADYKTTGSKKAFLTNDLKGLNLLLLECKAAYENRKGAFGWYLGERIWQSTILVIERNIEITKEVRESL